MRDWQEIHHEPIVEALLASLLDSVLPQRLVIPGDFAPFSIISIFGSYRNKIGNNPKSPGITSRFNRRLRRFRHESPVVHGGLTPFPQRGFSADYGRLSRAGTPKTLLKATAMKAFVVDKYNKKGILRLAEMPEPGLGDNDVFVEIHAAGVNLLDSKIRTGEFKPILPYRPPFTLGHDVAGTVVRVGSKVGKFKPGDEVYARPRDGRVGTFAEFIAMNEADVALKPKNLSMEEAASIPLVGLTAWQALVEKANLTKGQRAFIQAGSGGVGTFAIQLAKHLGATVATTTSSASANLVKDLGADIVIDYRKDNFEKILSDYDVVLNSQDAKTLEKSVRVLKPGGKLISISGPPDPEFAKEQGLNVVVRLVLRLLSHGIRTKAKRHGVRFSFLFMRAQGDHLSKITSLIESGAIRPVIDRVFPFEATREALAYVETGRAKGKVVVKVR